MVTPIEVFERSSKNKEVFIIRTPEKPINRLNFFEIFKNHHNRVTSEKVEKVELENETKNAKVSKLYFWSGGMGIVIALLNSCLIFCAWPQHHIFLAPKAWHEFMTTTAIGFIALFAASLILNSEVWLNIRTIKTWKNFAVLYLASVFGWFLANIGYYQIYSVMLGFKPPMPLNIHGCGIFTLIFSLLCFWFMIPTSLKTKEQKRGFQRRYGYYVLTQLFRYFAVLEYFFVAWLFVTVDSDYQWIIAILLTVLREMNGRILTRICYESAGFKSDAIKVTAIHEMACRHAVFLSVALSLLATKETAFVCIGLDFTANLFLCLQIIWRIRWKKIMTSIENDTDLQELALNEKTVYVVPLAYFICFLVAYLGPNRWIIGNVGNTSWHFGRVEELISPLIPMFIMFLVDFVGMILWFILLKIFCNICYFKGYMYLQKKYWLIMAVHEGYSLNEVSKR